jgi:hypothetical protein
MKKIIFLLGSFILIGFSFWVQASDDTNTKSSSKQVGGLLFDVDEGVEIQQGPGGSVYLKSNREYMEQKFKMIDARFKDLSTRIENLEKLLSKLPEIQEIRKKELESKDAEEISETNPRVYSTS